MRRRRRPSRRCRSVADAPSADALINWRQILQKKIIKKNKNGEQRALSAVVGCSVGRAYYFVWLGLFSKVQSEFASLADENELIGLV